MKQLKVLGPGCAKCQELYDLVDEAAKGTGVEYELEKISDINQIMSFGVMFTPALVVDGEVKFSGKVPSVEEISKFII